MARLVQGPVLAGPEHSSQLFRVSDMFIFKHESSVLPMLLMLLCDYQPDYVKSTSAVKRERERGYLYIFLIRLDQ